MILAHCPLNGLSGHEAGRRLLAQLYLQKTGQALPEIRVTELGKPFFPDSPWHFSISHTPKHAFCVLSEHNVGLDAEELDRVINPRMAGKILSPGEKRRYDSSADKPRALLAFWVLKEAEAKLTGKGLRLYPTHTDFSPDDPQVTEIDGCLVAVLTRVNGSPLSGANPANSEEVIVKRCGISFGNEFK